MDRVELGKIACYASEDADIAWRLAEVELGQAGGVSRDPEIGR